MAKTFTPSPGFGRDGDLLRSGTTVGRNASARLGFMPLALQHVILEGLAEIPVFLRTVTRRRDKPEYQFTLYATVATRFTEHHRERLKEAGVKFIYIQLSQQMRFHRQVEDYLDSAMRDPAVTTSAKSELLYETSVELVDELLVEQDLAEKLPRLESIARAVTTLVMNDTAAFSHLFATAQHDFYTATHMVNVGTWMVPLGYACGIEDMGELNLLCQAGMLHDIGKVFISETTLNKAGALSEQDWQELRTHPVLGHNRLGICNGVPDLVRRVALEHHERVDGSGYPAGLAGEAILLASRICAVVDSFDAMTAFRPFKERTMSFGEALRVLRDEAGSKYDQRVVDAWAGLMRQTDADCTIPEDPQDQGKPLLGRRKHERFAIDCQAHVQLIELAGGRQVERGDMMVMTRNISRSGLSVLGRQPIAVSQYVRVTLLGSGTLANRELEGQIVRCRHFTDGWHEMGMQFASLDSEYKAAENSTLIAILAEN